MANQISDMQEQMGWHWRNSMQPVRFGFDVRAIIFYILLFYARISTLVLCFVVTGFFWLLLEKKLWFLRRSNRPVCFFCQLPPWINKVSPCPKDYGR